MVAGRTCGIRFVWLVGIALSVSVIGPAIAQDAGGGVEATPASGTGADQGNGGSAKGGGPDVNMLFAPKGKGGKGSPPSGFGKVQGAGVGPIQPTASAKLQTAGPATASSNNGTLPGKASTAARAPIAAPPGDQASSSSRNAAAANGSSVNGTSMVRPADRTAAVGGPTKTAVGVLSGSSLTKRQ
ncbi:putative exported protein of unknown function [Bradyrhizobium sp. BTAi1]|jgi:hypothetical protein|nr:putative exported protein of unknown function [Bradyrhizobium sp. BTAi1]MDH6263880.1 hypothetical protein [Bradyrhizobium sp. BR13661]